ncbi:response regulator [Chlorogloea sp. CCALA 695]|uniref:response regulator n=1 Tax=Chlorogloea sp. CCALA 695 TaxID=2107693 RepID=UPI000D0553B0|nr:response regulator [Chlorogloea sp. CCALA 695]PSB31363.1 response regulator [Chlorogloea sp. CCALA 695]
MVQTQPNKILVIEDEELIRESIVYLLEVRGFMVINTADGYSGVRLAKELIPDLILCDIRLPGLDGYQVLRVVRADPMTANIPLIFLTAQISVADFEQSQNLAVNGYLAKPFTTAALLKVISDCLNKGTER